MRIGAQLYTVRDFCKSLDDFALTLRKVADIGYTTVQVSGTCAFEPGWLKGELDKNGLKCVITHTAPARLTAEPQQVCKDHDILGCDYVGLGSYRFDQEGCSVDGFLQMYDPVMDALKAGGKYFMYHNHHMEFKKEGGKTYDI